jgi:phosphonate transport system substrate-binding protein
MVRNLNKVLLVICLLFSFSYSNTITLAVLSSGNPVQEYKRYKNLSKYISKKLNMPVEIIIVGKAKELLNLYDERHVDISITCPVVYFELKDKKNIEAAAVIKINGKIKESGVIVVRKDSKIKNVQDLKDKKLTLGSSICASNCVMPLYVLSKEGITYKDIPDLWSSGSDRAAVLAVIAGIADAAGVKEETALQFKDKGIRILVKSPYVPRYVVNVSKDLPKDLYNKISNVFYNLKDEQTLKKLGIDGFEKPPENLFDILKDYKSILKRYPMLQ